MGRRVTVKVINEEVTEGCNLKLRETVLIPANTKRICPVDVFKNPVTSAECVVDCQFGESRYGLVIPPTVCMSDKTISIVIFNPNNYPVKLKKGCVLGSVHDTLVQETKDTVELLSDEITTASPDSHPCDKINFNPELSKEQLDQLSTIASSYHQVFSRSPNDLGKFKYGKAKIPLVDNYKVSVQPPRKYNQIQQDLIDKNINELLEIDAIEPSEGEFRSFPVLAARRIGQTWKAMSRFCIDFRHLQDQIRNGNCYSRSLPRINDIFDAVGRQLSGSKRPYFAKLDLTPAFHNIEIEESSRPITTFAAGRRPDLYQWKRCPYGLKISPNIFQDAMSKTMYGLDNKICFIYLDDILILGPTWKEFLRNLRHVLHRLFMSGLKLSPKKCQVGYEEVSLLGYVISSKGINIDPMKLTALSEWAVPKSAAETLSFVAFANYLRKHVENFAAIAAPLYALSSKTVNFTWTEEAQNAFDTLKSCLLKAPALRLPDFSKNLYLSSDWSMKGAAYCLFQREQDTKGLIYAILYGSKVLTKTEGSGGSHRGELQALCLAVKETRHYLHSAKDFCVFTDHISITQVVKSNNISAFQLRMLNSISELGNFKISYLSAQDKRIGIVDRLSRANFDTDGVKTTWFEVLNQKSTKQNLMVVTRYSAQKANSKQNEAVPNEDDHLFPNEQDDSVIDDTAEKLSLGQMNNEYWRKKQSEDKDIQKLKKWIQTGNKDENDVKKGSPALRSYYRGFETFKLQDGLVWKLWYLTPEIERKLVLVPMKNIDDPLYVCHDSVGHPGIKKTLENVRQHFFFWGARRDVTNHINSCETCQRRKLGKMKVSKLEPIPKSYFNERCSLDLKVLMSNPTTEGHKYILILVCSFTKYTRLVATKTKETTELLGAIWANWFCEVGIPDIVQTDGESALSSETASNFFKLFGVKHLKNSAYVSWSNGQAEALVKHTSNIMRALTITDQQLDGTIDVNWNRRLPGVQMAINSVPQTQTNISPFEAFTGRIFRIPGALLTDIPDERTSVAYEVRRLRQRQVQIYDLLMENQDKSQLSAKTFYDLKNVATDEHYEEGTIVLYRNYRSNPNLPKSFTSTFHPDHYIIVSRKGLNYFIKKVNDDKTAPICVHHNQIKRAVLNPEDLANKIELRNKIYRPARLGFPTEDAEGKQL